MATMLNPYIGFRDDARQALEFYRSVFGGALELATFASMQMSDDPADQDKIVHGVLTTPVGLVLMGSDAPSSMEASTGSRISIALSGEDRAEISGYWDGLADDATVIEPLTESPWGALFGMLTDRFGVTWMVNIAAPAA
jgi:PhnB protein